MPAPPYGGDALALYVHWPFCVSKCPYCDFNSHVRASVDQDAWRAALFADLAYEAALLPGRRLTSIFFGGGTPSLMPPATVAAIIDAATTHWAADPEIEITLEANPSSIEAARFADLAVAGVNRVSLGLQSLDDTALRFLGRAHDAAEGVAGLATAQTSFARVSFDLIYGLPGQSSEAWLEELARALSFGTSHVSLYQLTIEPGTRFAGMVARGEMAVPDPDFGADLFELTRDMTEASGLPAYEVSNHARVGEESRHNLTYWRYRDYAGVGPGAHGRRLGTRTQRHRKPENWLAAMARNGHGIAEQADLAAHESATEALLMGLRLKEGVNLSRQDVDLACALDSGAVDRMVAQNLLARDGDRIAATPAGMLLLDAVLGKIAV